MGSFAVMLADGTPGHGVRRSRAVVPNALMYRAHDRLFPVMTDLSAAACTYTIGFSGPMFRSRQQRPNFDGGTFTFGPRGQLSEYVDDYANEGGLPAQDARDFDDYARQSVSWTMRRDNRGVIIDSQWHEWVSRVTWAAHGDSKPDNWDAGHPGVAYQPPYKWVNATAYEGDQDFPWEEPYVFDGWYHDYSNVDPHAAQNPWSVDSDTMSTLGLWGSCGFPVGCVFVVVNRSGFDPELLAAALFRAPTWWRRSGRIAVRYVGRFG